jgi:hypothetical protein
MSSDSVGFSQLSLLRIPSECPYEGWNHLYQLTEEVEDVVLEALRGSLGNHDLS